MSATTSPSSQARNSNNKLYQVCYEAVVQGVQQLHITGRPGNRVTAAIHDNENSPGPVRPPNCLAPASTSTSASPLIPTPPAEEKLQVLSVPLLPSPPPSPTKGPPSALRDVISMNRSILHGAPPRGPAGYQPRYCNQDARANLAVQPATTLAKVTLKKAAVKVVRPSGTPAPSPTPAASAPGPVKSTPRVQDGYATSVTTTPKPSIKIEPEATPTKPTCIKAEPSDAESDLDALFNRLNSPCTAPVPADRSQPSAAPDKAVFTFDDKPAGLTAADVLKSYTSDLPKKAAAFKNTSTPSSPSSLAMKMREDDVKKPDNVKIEQAKSLPTADKPVETHSLDKTKEDVGVQDVERKYMTKASEYLNSLPTGGKAVTADLVKNVAVKLRRPYTPSSDSDSGAVESLKSQYLDTIATYCNVLGKSGVHAVTKDFLEQTLKEGNGDFLRLCAALVNAKVLAIDNIDEIVGLCRVLVGVLPVGVKPETTTSKAEAKPVSKDPMDSMCAWPSQEKRNNPAECRTCLIKGVSGFTNINQLQALVWGGRLESISMPTPGSGYALVKFLTAVACSKYFDATENGIEVPGEKKTVIFVEKQPGPNSTNDVIRNCIEGDTSRCVRAYDADEDWEDMALLRLANGKGQMKREVDRIKRGKTSRGRFYIEFRFSNIYHALNFKRSLVDDEDWEHCTVSYAPDPCETARGLHFKDEDEEADDTGFFT